MKRLLYTALAFLGIVATVHAADFTTVEVKDSISQNTTWTKDKQWLLKGYVYVTSGATLTIEPGTIIRGDKNTKGTLIIERGAKIMAEGTVSEPIIFTSNQPQLTRSYGDWGGIIVCGKAPTNWTAGEAKVEGGPRTFYGGSDPQDNSGVIKFVRIEFAGIALSPNNETNGLTLCAVGDKTTVEYVQVSYCGDDSYEWFGGTVNGKYLVSFSCWDDDFDTDVQYQGMNQFFVSVRDPSAADQSGSHAFEADAYQNGTATGTGGDTSKISKPVFSNGTIIGPMNTPAATYAAEYVAAFHPRRGSGISLLNSVIIGWPCAVLIDESGTGFGLTSANIGTNLLQFKNNIIAATATNSTPNPKEIVFVINGARSLTPTTAQADSNTNMPFNPYAGPWSWLKAPVNRNIIYGGNNTQNNNVKLVNPFPWVTGTWAGLNLTPLSASPICYNSTALPSYIPAGTFPGNVYPFNPTKPINTDTSNLFVNYNAPTAIPDFTNSKAANPFFTKVNYVGAFAGTQQTSDNWMANWTNFDPNNTFYDYVTSVETIKTSFEAVKVYPNPAASNATLVIELYHNSNLVITVTDITGKLVQEVFTGEKTKGVQQFNIDVANLNSGLYIVNVAAQDKVMSAKLKVIH